MAKTSAARMAANKRWDEKNEMTYQTIKIRKSLLDEFKAACAKRGDRVNTVLREAMEQYVKEAQD